jgi:hypothetical protein
MKEDLCDSLNEQEEERKRLERQKALFRIFNTK